jgi:uroporphyrinogen decarboxylase
MMHSRERVKAILNHQKVDRIAVCESFWPETVELWKQQGHLNKDETPEDHFGLDIRKAWAFNMQADIDFGQQIVEETEETKLVKDGNGALLRFWKDKSGTPEHVDFMVKDRNMWEEKIKPLLLDGATLERRMDLGLYRQVRDNCRRKDLYLCWAGINVFELMHPVCGHENMLMGMALDPGWVKDMCEVYSDLIIKLCDILFTKEGKPDGMWFFEDMGFKQKPFMSPAMYKDIIQPAHIKLFDYAHSNGLNVIVHSCGFVEPLIPGLIEAGMDCLQAMETKAGMDLHRIKSEYGNTIALMGGLDIRVLEENDMEKLDRFLEQMLPDALKNSGYLLHTDHSIPPSVNYRTYKHFVQKGLELGTY